MEQTLKLFVSESISYYNATLKFLKKVGISVDREISLPINVADLYDQPLPQYLTDALKNINETYFIGIVNDQSLAGNKTDESLDDFIHSEGKYDGMFIFACDAKNNANLTRSAIASLTRAFNRISKANPVILFILQNNLLTLSTCERMEYTQEWRQGEKLGKVSILRNINCQNLHRGHHDILESLENKTFSTFEDLYKHWMKVFSSELLTKKFYSELSDWYEWAIQVAKFPNDIRTEEDDTKYNHENCIRLITRLIFVWFLKQKHLIPDELFDVKYIRENLIEDFDPESKLNNNYNADNSNYYRLILQNLFFAVLNRSIVAEDKKTPNNRRFRVQSNNYHNKDYNVNNLMRYEKEFKDGGAKKFLQLANNNIPFLNGGLFDCLDDKPRGKYYDGFSERKESLEQLYLPDCLFFSKKQNNEPSDGIIKLLERYSFTIEENTPYDQEVSLDPELLGKVFENLLASYNPETRVTARNQTGSFYTPREIVQYMVDESLIAHLKRMCGSDMEQSYRNLLSYAIEEIHIDNEQKNNIMQVIYNCQVLDPACGSGAFPMGMLQQMVHILRQLDPNNEMWCEMIKQKAQEQSSLAFSSNKDEELKSRLEDIAEAFNQSINDPDYARKLYLIENCIYGVDIQPIAVQISKLRFFISLIVDQKPTNNPIQNFGIRPLPNLESKFVAANTLIPLDRTPNLFTATDDIKGYEQQLQEINHRIFLAKRNKEKEILRQLMIDTRKMMAQALENLDAIGPNGYQQLTEWNMFDQNSSAGFFDSEWMFGVKDGFDIVIGNPPYIQLQNNGGELAELYENYNYSTFVRTGDIYCLFYERGWQLLESNGHLCYITSNKWMRAGYGQKIRGFFVKNTNPKMLIDFAGVKVFESATVDTNILMFEKAKNQNKTMCAVTNKQDKDSIKNLSDFVRQQNNVCSFETSDSWVILSSIEQSIKNKIESAGTPLKDWDINIYRGVLTGCNEAFIISSEKREEILDNCQTEEERQRTAELIRPILRGRDIKRYGYEWANLYLIATFPACHYDIEKYPAVKNYLLTFEENNLRDAGYDWVANNYLADFCKQKLSQTGKFIEIVGKRITLGNTPEKARKKTNNKWFETQDNISYWRIFISQNCFMLILLND